MPQAPQPPKTTLTTTQYDMLSLSFVSFGCTDAANSTQSKLHWQVTVVLLTLLLHLTWSRTNRTMACNTHQSSCCGAEKQLRIPHKLEFAARWWAGHGQNGCHENWTSREELHVDKRSGIWSRSRFFFGALWES